MAILFPGQGSQTRGMGDLVEGLDPELHACAVDAVGEDPFARADESTRFAQPAILAASLALWNDAGRPDAEFFAGHSLGELGALAAAGAMSQADAVALAATRGRLMAEAADAEPGTMAAVLSGIDEVREIAELTGVTVANDNGATQTVIAGSRQALDEAIAAARERGLRTMLLPVAGAFHSPAMAPAVEPFRAALAEVEIFAPQSPVVSVVAVAPFGSPTAIREALAAAIVSPVRWRESLLLLHVSGVRIFRETGPGKALSALARRAFDDCEASPIRARGDIPV